MPRSWPERMSLTDPAPDKRVYFRNNATGDRGYMVERYGATHIRYDRPNVDQTVPFDPTKWTEEARAERRWNAHEVAQVSFAADRRLCLALGRHKESRIEWQSLPEEERLRWLKEGPKVPMGHVRQKLWIAIVGVFADG